jgi:hypothetical protein
MLSEFGRVIVLDHQHASRVGEHPAKPIGSVGRDRRAGRVLGPARDNDRRTTDRDRMPQTVHSGPLVVDRHGNRFQSERGDEVDQVCPARVLNSDPVARSQVAAEQALQRIQGSGRYGDGGFRHR